MKLLGLLSSSWPRIAALSLCCLCQASAAGKEPDPGAFRLHHDGSLRFSKSAASMRGIGKSLICHDDFELSVNGQFQMIGSSRLVRNPVTRGGKRYHAEPVCISIVAIGNVQVKFPETGESFSADTAVYLVSERSWILDGTLLKRGGTKLSQGREAG